MSKKIALGMSGGVDSSVCAHLLTELGHQVTGVYLECWKAPGCRTDQDRTDALAVALDLKIPFQVLDFKTAYRERVVATFLEQYRNGLTPNPDILCNTEIKFGLFHEWALKHGFDAIATGHYAARSQMEDGSWRLHIPADSWKDQTYFLHQITQKQLATTHFPLEKYQKDRVRTLARTLRLPNADKKDSVGICFIGDINVHHFLEEHLGTNPGEVVNSAGEILGTHRGLWFYTIGQRGGFQLDAARVSRSSTGEKILKQNIPPFYVINKKTESNQLVVGFGAETAQQQFGVSHPHWIGHTPPTKPNSPISALVRIRHTGELLGCTLSSYSEILLTVKLDHSTRGIAEGQYAVFYTDQGVCLGGGVITLDPLVMQ